MCEASRYHGRALVRRLVVANLADVPEIVSQIGLHRRWTDPLLWREHERAAEDSPARLHTALALLPVDGSLLDLAYDRLVQATPGDFPILATRCIRTGLRCPPGSGRCRAKATTAGCSGPPATGRYEPEHPRWRAIRENVARVLTGVAPELLGVWKDARPVRVACEIPSSRSSATTRPASCGSRWSPRRWSITPTTTPGPWPTSSRTRTRQVRGPLPGAGPGVVGRDRRAGAQLDESIPPRWPDPPPRPQQGEPSPATRGAIEAAGGAVAEAFAFCQGLPSDRLAPILEAMGAGYRPLRSAPIRLPDRDGRRSSGRATAGVGDGSTSPRSPISARPTRSGAADGLLPADFAFDEPGDDGSARVIAIWAEPDADVLDARLLVGPAAPDRSDADPPIEAGFNCRRFDIAVDSKGRGHAGSIWTRVRGRTRATTRVPWTRRAVPRGRLSRIPADGRSPALRRDDLSALWNVSTEHESAIVLAASPPEQIGAGSHWPRGLPTVGLERGAPRVSSPTATASIWSVPSPPRRRRTTWRSARPMPRWSCCD